MTAPNVTFTLADESQDITTLDVYFNAEFRPRISNDDDAGLGHKVRLTIPQADVAAAAAAWERSPAKFPTR